MRALGFTTQPIAPEIEALEMRDWRARTPPGAAVAAMKTICDRARFDALDLQQAIERERPEALLVDAISWGALAAAEAWGGPWACLSPLTPPLDSRSVPPLGPGWAPARGLPGRIRDRLARPPFRVGLDRLVLATVNRVRADLGLPPLGHAEEIFRRPPLLIYTSAEPFEYPRPDWPANVVLTGPCEWEPSARLPPELAAVERPLVLVTSSSDFQNDSRLARTALTALAGEPLHLAATLPVADLGRLDIPANATVLPFAPHAPILDRAACAITHGGMGSTQKALLRGVPVCAVPFGRDQLEVARRVEVAGAGCRLPAWRLSPDRLRQKVREAIGKRALAQQVGGALASAGGAAAAADAFEARLSRPPMLSTP